MDDETDTIRGYISPTNDRPRTEAIGLPTRRPVPLRASAPEPGPASASGPASGQRSGVIGGAEWLLTALVGGADDAFTGSLDVRGAASGRVTFQDGLIIDAGTSAAPGVESVLLRSGRVTAQQWTAVHTAGAAIGQVPALLVERGLLGRAGVQILARITVMDALFALASSAPTAVARQPARPGAVAVPALLPARPGIDARWAVRETARRLAVADQWSTQFGLTARSRPRPASGAARMPTAAPQVSLLAWMDGRRTGRDLAFALGRGIYPVLTDLAFLIQRGWIELAPPQGHPPADVPTRMARPRSTPADPSAPRPYGDRFHRAPATADTALSDHAPRRRYEILVDSPLPRPPISTAARIAEQRHRPAVDTSHRPGQVEAT